MPASRIEPDAVFEPAPAGMRVRWLTMLVPVFIFVVIVTVSLVAGRRDPTAGWIPVLVPAILVPFYLLYWSGARVRRYRLAGDELRIERAFQTVRFPLAGLESAALDREALRGARKIIGNDGLGAIAGRFRSQRLGRFQAYLTDTDHAVVLRWPDRCLVISPEQHSLFVETVRRRAGRPR